MRREPTEIDLNAEIDPNTEIDSVAGIAESALTPVTDPTGDHRSYFVYYSEVGLKRGNRPYFEQCLIRNIQHALRGLGVFGTHRLFGRIRLDQAATGDGDELLRRLARVHGVAHFEKVERFGWDLEPVEKCLGAWADEGGFKSFAIRCKRLEKTYPMRSSEIMIRLGSLVQSRSGAKVDLGTPEQEFHILVLNKEVILFRDRTAGPGGLPIGTAGRVLLMLSGGIDSPVAAERLFRRGCHLQFVHFHSSPFTDRSSIEKTTDLAQILTRHRVRTKMFLVPLGLLQTRIVSDAPARWRVMLYRRYMLRIAELIARKQRCLAIGSGENLAQVASQTLHHLTLLDHTVELPILRPLLTYDKNEIIAEAQRIGTFDVSIEPHSDCCGYLLPRKPVTDGTLEEILEIESKLDVAEEFAEILTRIESVPIGDEDPKAG